MVDFPWYMGMAPLLGWCLDAILRTQRLDTLLPRTIDRTARRMEFVLRNAFPKSPQQGGWLLVLGVGLSAWIFMWFLTAFMNILQGNIFEHSYFTFIAWTATFYLCLGVRERANSALRLQRALNQDRPDVARAWLEHMGGDCRSDTPEALAGAGIQQVARGIVQAALVPLVWGLLLGAGGALGALCIQELSRQVDEERARDPFWEPIQRTGRWMTTLPAWLGLLCIQTAMPLAGGSRSGAMAGFLNRFGDSPVDRTAAGMAYGLRLGPAARGSQDGGDVEVRDLHRAVVVLWTSTGLAAGGTALVAALIYHFFL